MHGKRIICPRCQRPERTCLCRWITPLANRVQVVILQHPLEVHNAKNSARLLHLSLANSQMLVGESFSIDDLQTLLADDRHNILLYPSTSDPSLPEPPPLPSPLPAPERLRLIVLDATWRKSRKMLYLNPLLQQFPRLPLDGPPSIYRIRKAHGESQLSTLEACCYALAQLEELDHLPLLSGFEGFVEHLGSFDPSRYDTPKEN
jgi:DTW domain-containing protein